MARRHVTDERSYKKTPALKAWKLAHMAAIGSLKREISDNILTFCEGKIDLGYIYGSISYQTVKILLLRYKYQLVRDL